ncbi:hypothetical protein JXB31_03985, partial [Candidatus Woesearchaeota archaeon]|nr:hypothetical protein [Candidatus Woesearchaeota archaeon]
NGYQYSDPVSVRYTVTSNSDIPDIDPPSDFYFNDFNPKYYDTNSALSIVARFGAKNADYYQYKVGFDSPPKESQDWVTIRTQTDALFNCNSQGTCTYNVGSVPDASKELTYNYLLKACNEDDSCTAPKSASYTVGLECRHTEVGPSILHQYSWIESREENYPGIVVRWDDKLIIYSTNLFIAFVNSGYKYVRGVSKGYRTLPDSDDYETYVVCRKKI